MSQERYPRARKGNKVSDSKVGSSESKGATQELLLTICAAIHRAHAETMKERKRERFGDDPPMELLVMRMDKIRVEVRKENVSHNEPHLHISHSDIIDVSLSLRTFDVLAGTIDRKTLKRLLKTLEPRRQTLMDIWNALNEDNNEITAEKLISNMTRY